jgi:hypothetical protein
MPPNLAFQLKRRRFRHPVLPAQIGRRCPRLVLPQHRNVCSSVNLPMAPPLAALEKAYDKARPTGADFVKLKSTKAN